MTAIYVPKSQQSTKAAQCSFFEMNTLRASNAVSLRAHRPMQLRILADSGEAWVTLPDGPYGTLEDSGDVLLAAGQILDVLPGKHVVMEPVTGLAVRYQWKSPDCR